MAWTTPQTWTSALVTVSEFNTHIRDNLLALLPSGAGMTSVTHASGNFTASSGTWTVDSGDQTIFAYIQIGKMMTVTFDLQTTSVSATPAELRIAIPNSKTATRACSAGAFAYYNNATTAGTGNAVVSGTTIALYRDLAGTTWSAATNATRVQGTIVFEVN